MQLNDFKYTGCLLAFALITYAIEYTCRKLLFFFRLALVFASFAVMTKQRPATQQIKRWLETAGIEEIPRMALFKNIQKAATTGLQAVTMLFERGGAQDTSIKRD
ncbi:hypothetical protein FPRO04_13901 [Fusarium proliferatum]|uniref:Uncharacterized protein n=3 Tax=Fusarium oxysporum species complex TaxID=171631 RepID=N4TW70_FUSC1|nr:uncharacterized protein FOIG_16759 [Fusarium odoratissimum NRRL 54006]ENH63492.1 hypothetical protein FOC1_g10000177 [Fusarium oxysporum f. sp. cubense race 1]KAG4278312.1 hypothetical protein FPRO04_13901 [Fusarium proliferatum]KAK2469586.1 hypothetical protein H9L39_18857 [Fusarium oxysporum f. sp. albedinis]TVY74218.1 hypothetical protein Focb16_v005574 [Fusarium oxysporum f. sp. cubense]EXL89962.1 hypothetical protein FOIG_16759 [Fusarium odoratissimum NRRL 54006]